jgi:ATP-dependent Clp protease ATP-binding subunit ClpA
LGNGDALAEGEENGHAPGMELSDDLTAKLDGFTRPTSDCINKARRIARELNHTSVSAAHLVLAMTLDSRANRRLRDRGVDVDEVRETAIQLLAKHNNLYSDGQHDPAESPRPAPDLADILEAAARYAQESEDEEEIKITDLLDAFPKSGSRARLIYDPQGFSDQVPAVVRRVEQTLAAQMDTLIAGLENTVLASTQDRLDSMVGGVSAQLNEQIAALRQANMLLSEHVRVILQAKRPEAEDRGRWPWK